LELDIRSIKARFDEARVPDTVHAELEIWATFWGYNLVRKVSCQAALSGGQASAANQFTRALQAVRLRVGRRRRRRRGRCAGPGAALLAALGKEEVGDRPAGVSRGR